MKNETFKELHNQVERVLQRESNYYEKQWNLIHQMKREMDNWENYEYWKKQGSSMFDGRYEIYSPMLRISQEFVSNFNNYMNSNK